MSNTLGLDVHGTTTVPSEPQPSDSTQWATTPSTQWGEGPSTQWGEDTSTQSWGADAKDGEAPPEAPLEAPPEAPTSPKQEDKSKKEKGKPYVPATPAARVKLTPEELAERMEKIRLQNEKIKERREHVKADEEAFNTSVAVDRAKQAANRKVQAQINQNRELNAKRKLEKMGNREWDSGKQGGEWKQGKRPTEDKGRGNSFSIAPVGRDTGGSPQSNRNVHKGSSPSTESAERPSREDTAQPDTSSSQTDVQNGEERD